MMDEDVIISHFMYAIILRFDHSVSFH